MPPTLVLLCAPSMGILDAWLPVLDEAVVATPPWRVAAVIPDRETLAQLDGRDTAHVLADGLVHRTVAPLVDGGWISAPGLLTAGAAARPGAVASALLAAADALARRLGRTPFTDRAERHALTPLLRLLRTRAQRRAAIGLSELVRPDARLLHDATLHDKPRLAQVLKALKGLPRHSMQHGIALLEDDGTLATSPDKDGEAAAYLYGRSELAAYRDGLGIAPERLHVVGVVRHAPEWIEWVISRSRELHPTPFERAVFVVSRPAGSPYLPADRKVRLLRDLHRVAWEEHGLPLVLRTHPKESEDGTFAAALPADGEGVSWAISDAHPFHLARHSHLGVVLFSGVAVDLVALGVPVVQLLDVEGLDAISDARAPRDASGRRRFGPYARDGLVHCADGAEELRALLQRADADRAALLEPLRARYDALFALPERATEHILRTFTG